jgi:repressor LexA
MLRLLVNRPDLTDRQNRILEAIAEFIEENQLPPTVRELGERFDVKSSTVFAHLKALEKKGYIRRTSGKSRGLALVKPIRSSGIPMVGRVQAGPLAEAIEQPNEYLDIDENYFGGGNLFALRVSGDSMIDAGILDGDTVIVSSVPVAEDGQIVVVGIDNEVTVKRLRRKGGAVMLEPANRNLQPLVYGPGDPSPEIVGRVVGVLRRL